MSDLIWQMPQDNAAIRAAFAAGWAFAYPTEAVWGIGANPANEAAVQAVIALKARPAEKGLIMVAADWSQLDGWITPLAANEIAAMQDLQHERATTFVVKAGHKTAAAVCDAATGRVAVRISHHQTVQVLCRLLGQPLLSTSANPAGQTAALDLAQVRRYFPDLPCVMGEVEGAKRPSRIIDWQTKVILRE